MVVLDVPEPAGDAATELDDSVGGDRRLKSPGSPRNASGGAGSGPRRMVDAHLRALPDYVLPGTHRGRLTHS